MAAKEKADNSAYKQLKQDLAAGTLGRLYVLHGEEAYLRSFYLDKMKEQLVGQGMAEFNLHILQGKDLTPDLLEQTVDALPMMSERTMVLVEDYDLFKAPEEHRQALTELFGQLPDYCCVVFLYDTLVYKADSRTKLAAALKANGSVVEFARQGQGDLVDWVHRRFKALGKEIDTAQAQYLIFFCGDLMNALIGEIEKISAYARGPRITRQDIEAVATPQLDAVVFEMTNAIGVGDFDKAAQVLGELFQMQEKAIPILAALGKQLRQLYSARLLLERRGTAGDLAAQWKMNSSYQAEKLMSNAGRFSLAWCRKAVTACAETDLALKSSSGTERELMADLLLKLSAPSNSVR